MNKTLCKLLMVLPIVLLADWVLMILFGCFAGACNANNQFFCTIYCYSGLALLVVSVIISVYLVFRKKIEAVGQ